MAIGSDILNVAVVFSAIDRLTRPISRMTAGMNKLQQSIYYADRYMQDMFIKTSIAATGIIAVTKQMVDAFAWTETALANMTTALNGDIEKADKLLKLIDKLEDDDDVQQVIGNFEIPDEIMEKIS